MNFENTPYHLRYNIEEIMIDARKHITVHYLHNIAHSAGKSTVRGSTGCQIIDENDYSRYFYEPKRFAMPEPRTIRCTDQRSAHQNAIIALKKWEEETRNFLTNPPKPAPERTKKKTLSVRKIERALEEKSSTQRSSQWQRSQPERLFQNAPNSLLV